MNHYPAVEVLESSSRVMRDVVDKSHLESSLKIIDILSAYREAEDLLNIGAYVAGSNKRIDYACSKIDAVNQFLTQEMFAKATFSETVRTLIELINQNTSQEKTEL